MTCELIQSQLTAFLDGELPSEAAAPLEAHLRTCSECAKARDHHAALSETLSVWAVPASEITASVMQSVTADALALLRAEVHALRTEITLLREEVAGLRRPVSAHGAAYWYPSPTPNYARMEEDPWNSVRS